MELLSNKIKGIIVEADKKASKNKEVYKDLKTYKKEWEDAFFTNLIIDDDDTEIVQYDDVFYSDTFKNYSAKQKHELVQFIWETYDIEYGDHSSYPDRKLWYDEREKWQFLYNHLPKEIEIETINSKKERITGKLQTNEDIEEKIEFLERELIDIEQNQYSSKVPNQRINDLIVFIYREIRYWELKIQKRPGKFTNSKEKIKYKKVSHLAYLLRTLVERKYIELPSYIGNETQAAKYFFNFFDLENLDSFISLYQHKGQGMSGGAKDKLNSIIENQPE